jgi:HEAT repeat protein
MSARGTISRLCLLMGLGVNVFCGEPSRNLWAELDARTRETLTGAVAQLRKQPGDLEALATLAEFFGTERLRNVEEGGPLTAKENVVNEAWGILCAKQPIVLLATVIEKGKSPAVDWALHRATQQHIDSLAAASPAAPGKPQPDWFIGDEGRARLRDALLQAVEARPAPLCSRALFLAVELEDRGNAKELARRYTAHANDEVAGEAIRALALRERPNTETANLAWRKLETSNSPVMLAACCQCIENAGRGAPALPAAKEDILDRVAKHPDRRVRVALAQALVSYARPNTPRLVGILLMLTDDKEPNVRTNAVESLRKADTPEVNERLTKLCDPSQPWWLRGPALETLAQFGAKNLAVVLAATKDEGQYVRYTAARCLNRIGTPEALAALEHLAEDPAEAVRKEAKAQLSYRGRK